MAGNLGGSQAVAPLGEPLRSGEPLRGAVLAGEPRAKGMRAVLRWLTKPWRSSMQVKVVSTSLVVGALAMASLGGYISTSIRDGVFEQRVNEILLESARSTRQAQATFDTSTAGTSAQVQQLLNDLLPRLRSSGTNVREVFLRRPAGSLAPSAIVDVATSSRWAGLITDEIRSKVANPDGQVWQSVALPNSDDDGTTPGVVVGAMVEVPLAGSFELYYVYSLGAEQESLQFIARILVIGAVALVAVLAAITWIASRQVVRPVRLAANTARKFADGSLTARIRVRGQDEMATLATAFNEMAGSLQEQIQRMEDLSTLQRRFVSDVSHELRTPLTTIRMAAEMIHASKESFEPAVRRSAELLALQLDRFEDLLTDLLEISRFDAGAASLDAERQDVRAVVDRALDQAMLLAQSKGIFVSARYCEASAMAEIDPRRVERIVRNLLVNAIEHAEGGPVHVLVDQDASAVAVLVRDFGVGMSPDAAAHVFDRFWRADPARARTTGGTGLGLSISLEDAHLHGGWLQAWGEPGEGAVFRLTLPVRAGMKLLRSPLPLRPERDSQVAPIAGSGPSAVPRLEFIPEGAK